MSNLDRRETMSTVTGDSIQIIEPSFDENVLRTLCDIDVSFLLFVTSHVLIGARLPQVRRTSTTGSNKAKYGVLPGLSISKKEIGVILKIFLGGFCLFQETRCPRGRVWTRYAEAGEIDFGSVFHE